MGWLDSLIGWIWGWFESSENKKVQAVRDATRSMCGFWPTAETVLALLAVNSPAAVTAFTIARKICVAVTAQRPAMLVGGAPPIIVDGVVIEGEFDPNWEGK